MAKQTHKLMQVNASLQKNRACVRTWDWWPNGFSKSTGKFTQVAKGHKFHTHTVDLRSACVDLRWVVKRWKTCIDLRVNLSLTKVNASTQVVAIWYKSMQVGGQTKHKLNASSKLGLTCEFVWPGFNPASTFLFYIIVTNSLINAFLLDWCRS